MINRHQNDNVGTQPVRVLQKFIPYTFEKTNPTFLELVEQVIKGFDLNPGFTYHINEFPISQVVAGHKQTPYLLRSDKTIYVHETFLSYLWCVSYSLISIYDIGHPTDNKILTEIEISQKIETSYSLFKYGISLVTLFSTWDKTSMPNPEVYEKDIEEQVMRANYIFLYAINYILCHEFSHVEKGHHEKIEAGQNSINHLLQFEREADQRAIDLMQAGATDKTKQTINIGILVGLSAILFLSPNVRATKHPDTDDRIHNFLEQVNAEDSNGIWGIAYIAYKLWENQFSKYFSWLKDDKSLKELYYDIRAKVQLYK